VVQEAQSLTDGERWTVEALTALRRDGYRPGEPSIPRILGSARRV